jgi:hypothetical protein
VCRTSAIARLLAGHLQLLVARRSADRTGVIFGLCHDVCDRESEGFCEVAELAPGVVAQPALDAREVGVVYVGHKCDVFDGGPAAIAQPPDSAADGGLGGRAGGTAGPWGVPG